MAEASRAEDEPRRQIGDSPLDVARRSDLMNWAFDEYLRRQPDPAASSRLTEIEQAFLVLEERAGGLEGSHDSPRRAA